MSLLTSHMSLSCPILSCPIVLTNIGGNYKTGVAFGDCVQYGFDVAKDVTAFLTEEKTPEGLSMAASATATAVKVEEEENVSMSS